MSQGRVVGFAVVCATGALSFHRKEKDAAAEARLADGYQRPPKHGPCGPHRVARLVEERPKNAGPMTHTAPEDLLAVADAAVAWWATKRPMTWAAEAHLGQPQINCAGAEEKALAERVARWVALEMGIAR